MVPLTPALILIAVRLNPLGTAYTRISTVAAFVWLAFLSVAPVAKNEVLDDSNVDPNCKQAWIRAPIHDDLGLYTLTNFAKSSPLGAVLVVNPPHIPCWLQTSHDWESHITPYLRREGQERKVIRQEELSATERDYAMVAQWSKNEPVTSPNTTKSPTSLISSQTTKYYSVNLDKWLTVSRKSRFSQTK